MQSTHQRTYLFGDFPPAARRLSRRCVSRVEDAVGFTTSRLAATTLDAVAVGAARVSRLAGAGATASRRRRPLPQKLDNSTSGRDWPVLAMEELAAREEWDDGRRALDRFLVDLGAERGCARNDSGDPAHWEVGDTTAEVGLVYGTPVISITKGGRTARLPICQANADLLRAAHAHAGRIDS